MNATLAARGNHGAVVGESVRTLRPSFDFLDGLRGIAAVMVLFYHAHALFGEGEMAPSTYLAVDIFFVLSGFVLSFAYDRRLASGLGWVAFMVLRLKRLLPAYLAALLIGAGSLVLALMHGSSILPSYGALLWSTSLGLLFLPTPPGLSGRDALYATNPAAWSIFYELLVNFFFAVAFPRIRGKVLASIIVLGAVAIAMQSLRAGSVDLGAGWTTAGGGLARVTFSFFIGVLLQRIHRSGRLSWQAPWWLVTGALTASFFVQFDGPLRIAYEWFCVGLLYPLAIVFAANVRAGPRLSRAFSLAGSISYPVYILHTPLLFLSTGIAVRVMHSSVEAMRPWGGLVITALVVVIAFLFHRFLEQPILDYLRRGPDSARGVANA